MSNILENQSVLRLNANYQRIGWSNAKQVFIAMNGGDGEPPYLAINFEYDTDENGYLNPKSMISWTPCTWEEWITLPIRSCDEFITTSKLRIRIPTVVVCTNYNKMPMKEQRPTPLAIRQRDNNQCQYTGVKLTNKTYSLDHVIPRSKRGKDNWENLVLCHKDVNAKKGNRFNHEVGLRLLKQPKAPKSIPLCGIITQNKHEDHKHF